MFLFCEQEKFLMDPNVWGSRSRETKSCFVNGIVHFWCTFSLFIFGRNWIVFFFSEKKRSGGDFHYRLQKLQKRDGENWREEKKIFSLLSLSRTVRWFQASQMDFRCMAINGASRLLLKLVENFQCERLRGRFSISHLLTTNLTCVSCARSHLTRGSKYD